MVGPSPIVPTSFDSAAGWPGRIAVSAGTDDPGGSTVSIVSGAGTTVSWKGGSPKWAPDGRKIAFLAWQGGDLPGLWVRDAVAAGTGRTQLILDGARSVTWSPTGDRLAVDRSPVRIGDTWLVAPDGSGLRELGIEGYDLRADLWSPDGTRVAGIASLAGESRHEITICDVRSGSCSLHGVGRPFAWSPDGALLAVETGPSDALALDLGTGATRPIVADGHVLALSWSAHGRIAAVVEDGHLFVIDGVGAPLRAIAQDLRVGERPEWSPDGRWLAVRSGFGMPGPIFVVEVDGPNRWQVFDGYGFSAAWDPGTD